MSPVPPQPFTCTFCWHMVPHGRPVKELFDESEDGDGDYTGRLGTSTGKQILDIPMCVHCAVACENDNKDTLLEKALGRIDVADGGLSRQRWMASMKKKNALLTPLTKLNQLGGDSSMDMPEPSDPPLAVTTKNNDEDDTGDGDEETIAKLHYRRSKDPRFAELECLVPLDSSVYVSILDPLNAPAFRPCPAKPLPEWMHLLPGQNCRDDARPRSILDVHFPPAAAFVTREMSPPLSRVDEVQGREERTGTETELELVGPRFPSTTKSLITSPPPSLSPPQHQHRGLQRRTSSESLHSQFLGSAESTGSPHRSLSPADSRFLASASPPPYKRPSAVANEPLRRPSSRLTGLYGVTDEGHKDVTTSVDIRAGTANAATNNRGGIKTSINTKPTLEEKGKGKSVAWDKTVSGGESETSCESYERMPMERGDGGLLPKDERPQTPPQRRPSPLAAVWQRIVKTKTPPAQSKEFLDLYAADQPGETRLASLAMPGRRRGKEVGWARGRSYDNINTGAISLLRYIVPIPFQYDNTPNYPLSPTKIA
ncbi:hypothetical protein GGR51DRAFT_547617 [Nemania sp. FL0031]|nr:hypothetical protein GGR51DRAFT_547617 [Nemania sp. FL0031]